MVEFYEGILNFFEKIGAFIESIINGISNFFTLLPTFTEKVLSFGGYVPVFIAIPISLFVGICVIKIILDLL